MLRVAARSRTSRSRTSIARFEVVPIWKSPFGAQTYWLPAIGVLGGMGLLILLVVCANVANLVLVRGVSRRGELASGWRSARAARRLLRLLFVENLVLAIPGALGGVALASVLLPFVASGAAGNAPSRVYLDTSVDGYVMTFAHCAVVLMRDRLRFRAGAADVARRIDVRAERSVAAAGGARPIAIDAGRLAGRRVAGPAGRRRPGAAQLRRAVTCRAAASNPRSVTSMVDRSADRRLRRTPRAGRHHAAARCDGHRAGVREREPGA